MFEKIYILSFLVVYFLVVFVIPSVRVKRKTGINPYVFNNTDSAHDFLGKVSAPITSLIFIQADPPIPSLSGTFASPHEPSLRPKAYKRACQPVPHQRTKKPQHFD